MYGTKIRLIRLSRGMNQEEVAQKLDILQNAYSKTETNQNKVSDAMVDKLAVIFGVSAEDIKSPEPVIINFHNSPKSNGVNNEEVKDQNEQLFQQLIQQLAVKDKHIEGLMEQIKLLLNVLKK
jgi:transcriptional regulator with XRE-family HTH domain